MSAGSSWPMRCRRGAAATKAVVVLALAAGLPDLAIADSAAIARCRQQSDTLLRLKCYDEIPLPPAGAAAAPAPAGSAGSPPATSAPPAAPAAAAAPADPAARFGLENRPKPAGAPDAIAAIESHIPGRVDGWVRNSRFRLANGQVWEIRENSPASYDLRDPKVRIVRGFSGSFFMELEGVSRTPRVVRVE